jgi:dTDP-4-amino-4,6-dideoxygalactose transaminase
MGNIQMVDIHTQYQRLKPEIDAAMAAVIDHTQFINGPEVKQFTADLQSYLNVKHVIPCANGTDALQVALMALNLEAGDEVITSDFTFIASVEVIALLGLKPVLVDVDPNTFEILPEQIEAAITPKTKAIIPVHLFGQGCNMSAIMAIAKKYNLYVIEDTAQALGAKQLSGNQKLGTIGDVGCTSFFPSKNLGCFGDGGACFTNNDEFASHIRSIINHGSEKKYYHDRIGVNSRLDTLQAAILQVKLRHLDDFNERRQRAAAKYDSELGSIRQLQIPVRTMHTNHIFHQYTLRVLDGSRNELIKYLTSNGVPCMVYYPRPLHAQQAFQQYLTGNELFPNADLLSAQVLSLPMHTELDDTQINKIVTLIKNFYTK